MNAAWSHPRLRAGLALLLCSVLYAGPGRADDAFVVERAEFRLDDSLLLLDLVVQSEIPDYIALAIEQGFAVPIMFEAFWEFSRACWFDAIWARSCSEMTSPEGSSDARLIRRPVERRSSDLRWEALART